MNQDSVTIWLRQLGLGDQEAARQLWDRYSSALMRLAQHRYRGAIDAVADEEDLVQSVFKALWTGATGGGLDAVKDRTELWWLLLAITRRKAINRKAYNGSLKRGQNVVSLNQFDTVSGDFEFTPFSHADDQPPPELILMLEEEQQRLLATLRDDVLRSIAVWKLEGQTHEDIAEKLNVAPRTIIRKLNVIRETWSKELEQ